jgi:hypothetical protein
MARTAAPAGVSLTTSLLTVYTNTSGDAVRRTVRVRFSNIDGVNDANITACNFYDSSGATAYAMLPVNAKVAKLDAIAITKVLEPGDYIQASASAAGDIVALAEVIFTEPN